MSDSVSERNKFIAAWHTAFKKGTDFDLWGQPVEAIDVYLRLAKQLQQEANVESPMFNDEQKRVLGKIATCLDLRSKALQNPGHSDGISLEDLRKIETSLKNLLFTTSKDFPVNVNAAQAHQATAEKSPRYLEEIPDTENQPGGSDDEDNDEFSDPAVRGNLLPKPVPIEGKTFLSIHIEKIGLKDAIQCIDPFITVSVKDLAGSELTPPQDTPIAVKKQEPFIIFGVDVHIQRALDFLPAGYAVFFEFKHYKPKKRKTSKKCWAFIEKDEIKDGSAVVELYKKPSDFKRKNIHLLTVKPLYLHLYLELNSA